MRLRAQVEGTAMLGLVAAGRQCCALVLPSSTRALSAAASQSGCFSRSSRRSDGRRPLSVGSSWSHQQQHRLTTYRTIEERPHVPRHLRSTTVDLAEGEEEIATVDVSPEEIAAFFEQPSYEAAQAGGKHLPGATATLLESNPRHIHVLDGFLQQPQAAQLRGVFDERFSKPREGTAERFVWDWWHVPEQYTLMRTPAEEYFGPEGFEALTAALCKFGQEQLGCRAISPPWLSVYIDGCEQRFHTDAWHGPWAFVLSLTDWDGKDFTGGETQILKPHVLNYWNSFAPGIGLEEKHFLDTIEPHFNRLTLFDPRFPHGVKPVRGTRDPRKGRLVLHGWFTDPQPYFSGGLSEEEATEALNRAMEASGPALAAAEGGRVTGTLTVRLHVSGADGSVRAVSALTDTLVADPTDLAYDEEGDPIDARAEAMLIIHEALGGADFPCSASGEDTFITVPYAFE